MSIPNPQSPIRYLTERGGVNWFRAHFPVPKSQEKSHPANRVGASCIDWLAARAGLAAHPFLT